MKLVTIILLGVALYIMTDMNNDNPTLKNENIPKITGEFYSKYIHSDTTVYTFFEFKNSKLYSDNALFLDIEKKQIFRKSFSPKIIPVIMSHSSFKLDDKSSTHYVETVGWFSSEKKKVDLEYKITKLNNDTVMEFESVYFKKLTYKKLIK